MSRRERKESIDVLVQRFATAVMKQEEEIHKGSASRGNRHAKRQRAAVDKLFRLYGDQGREALKGLFSHENDEVRCSSAAILLRYCTNDAMLILKDIAKNGRGFSCIGAFYCLKNWEEGTWALDPEPSAADEEGGNGTEPPSSER